jgi:Spy/CpxP family protein refolding chaperone
MGIAMSKLAIIGLSIVMTTAALARDAQPYTGLESRSIKALSEQQISDLKSGRGMGLALPAELNGYPGPMHVLEHADALRLSKEQRDRTQKLFQDMKAEAIPAGERLIALEAQLDDLFAQRKITPATLSAATSGIGRAQAELREAHLKYHLAMVEILTPAQIARYASLRGYGSKAHTPQRHHHRH